MQRRMTYGDPPIAYRPLLHSSPAGLFVNGRPLMPSDLIGLDDEPLIVATTSSVYSAAIDMATRCAPFVARRWSFWRSLAYNPHCVVISKSLERLYHDPPARLSLSRTPQALATFGVGGTVRALQDGYMARIMASARYARYDAGSDLTTTTAARLYRHAASIASDWRNLVNLDPLASLDAVGHGDVGQGHLDAHLGTSWRVRFIHPPKLRPGPVYVRFDHERCGEAKVTELSADARGLWAVLAVPETRTERLGANPSVTRSLLASAYRERSMIWVSDRTYVSAINLDQLGPWDGSAPLIAPAALRRKDAP